MNKVPCYNTTICTKLDGQSFEDYLKTERNDRYELMCSVDAFDKQYVSITYDTIIVGGRPIPIASSKEALLSLGHTINFIEN